MSGFVVLRGHKSLVWYPYLSSTRKKDRLQRLIKEKRISYSILQERAVRRCFCQSVTHALMARGIK
ncbi:hypothetical protein LINPERPRIM_LOCUS29689 [Linum perenne]